MRQRTEDALREPYAVHAANDRLRNQLRDYHFAAGNNDATSRKSMNRVT